MEAKSVKTCTSTSSKPDYQKQLEEILKNLPQIKNPGSPKKSLLLHACCAPCSSYVLEYLSDFFDITIYYYNPNIHPQSEYERRLTELKHFLPEFTPALKNKVRLIEAPYSTDDYFNATKVLQEPELQTEAERGERCRRCYKFRMEKAFNFARENHFDYFTTTLSISPHKDSLKINAIGFELVSNFSVDNLHSADENFSSTQYLPADFKKKSGYLRSTQLSREYNLWRQDYCGCIYSKQNEENRRKQKLESNKESPLNQTKENPVQETK